jgi:hypothetical protein
MSQKRSSHWSILQALLLLASGVEYLPMVRLRGGRLDPDEEELLAAVDATQGATLTRAGLIALTLVVNWSDSSTPCCRPMPHPDRVQQG